MTAVEGKRMIPVYVSEAVYREIKVYGAETDKTIQEVCKIPSEAFEQSAIQLVSEIKEMKRKAEEERIRQEEANRLSMENPLQVPGHEVEPISV